MLLAQCQDLTQKAQKYSELEKHASDLEQFQDHEKYIKVLVQDLKPFVIALSAFQNRIPEQLELDCQSIDLLSVEVNKSLTEFRNKPGWLLEGFKRKSLRSKVDSLRNELDTLLRSAWKSYKQARIPKTNNELLDLLGKIETFRPTVERVRSLHAQIEAVPFPQDSEHFQRLEQGIDDMSNAWNSLSSNDVPESVLNFLKAASTFGASLDSLTPEVEVWLKEQGITRFFQVKLTD